jgi:hypothetical protein
MARSGAERSCVVAEIVAGASEPGGNSQAQLPPRPNPSRTDRIPSEIFARRNILAFVMR